MSLVKFSEFSEALKVSTMLDELEEDCCIVEWTEEDWHKFSVKEKAELESEAVNGWAIWAIGKEPEEDDDAEIYEDETIWEYINSLEEYCDTCGKEPCECDISEYKARNTMQRRKTQKNKDRLKFSNRATKLRAKIDRKKGGNKVKRIKMRKKWMRKNKSKIKNAQKVFGGKVKSKFTKK
jgi:hypothetical protein